VDRVSAWINSDCMFSQAASRAQRELRLVVSNDGSHVASILESRESQDPPPHGSPCVLSAPTVRLLDGVSVLLGEAFARGH